MLKTEGGMGLFTTLGSRWEHNVRVVFKKTLGARQLRGSHRLMNSQTIPDGVHNGYEVQIDAAGDELALHRGDLFAEQRDRTNAEGGWKTRLRSSVKATVTKV